MILHRADGLPTATPLNPYVKTYLVESVGLSYRRDSYSKKKTKTKKLASNPVYEETLEYFVPAYNLKYHKIEVSVQLVAGCGCFSTAGQNNKDIEMFVALQSSSPILQRTTS